MKRFNFALQKVFDLRQYYEDEAKLNLGRAMGELAELENKLAVLGQEQARAAASQFNPENSTHRMRQYMLYLLRLEGAKEQLLRETAAAELKVEEARTAFFEAARERKILGKLREKQQREHYKFVLDEETKTLDDISRVAIE